MSNDHEESYKAQSRIEKSGNSDVDVHITIDLDVKPVAFAMLYSLLASQQLTSDQFEEAIKRLQEL
ncbi:hypothetical protein [Metabacillus endolithicus]|uniref:Uncharacterized protein n=1 Tax=Metabacillus endolithicus TaxID=1535204 RepID=A0ABW5C6Y9_9BACI|nr:hypothetical protein [Metabacillus endolithicus]UPG63887.1 hypothetical protein MVE64_01650 [Metabacillus endolithicus]